MDNPYRSPVSDTLAVPADEVLKEYGGIGRLGYLGYSFLVGVLGNLLGMAVGALELGPTPLITAIAVVFAVTLALTLYVCVQRLKNMGYSGWWSLLAFVPLANIFLGLRCLICPAGYADTKKLDRVGKIVALIAIGVFLLAVLLVVLPLLLGTP